MHAHLITLTAIAALMLGGPGHAQTEVNCSTAAQALESSPHAGKILDLRVTHDEMAVVNGIIHGSIGSIYLGHADNIQIYYIEPGNYMLMASVQGCHVAHVFVDGIVFSELASFAARTEESRPI